LDTEQFGFTAITMAKRNPGTMVKKSKLKKKRGQQARRDLRQRATQVLAPGAGAVPKKAFAGDVRATSLACWDAKLPHHLALPRAVGPYTVIRTTRRFNTASPCVIFGTFKHGSTGDNFTEDLWASTCAVAAVDASLSISAPSNAVRVLSPLTFLKQSTSAASCTPSAVTVQIMNPNALQTTSGMIYAGVMHTQALVGGRTETWNSYFDRFVNFQSPRMMAAARLALRGVQVSSYPLDMNALSDFTQLATPTEAAFNYDSGREESNGFAPILLYNPSGVNLEFLVTTEWRARFDLQNPASAGHVHHPISSDSTWDNLVRRATALGNGVRDIADVVSSAGQLARALPMLAA
jgi:hypothetical protein